MRSVLQCLPNFIIMAQGVPQVLHHHAHLWFLEKQGDGNAEIAVYELSTIRYGEERKGYAIAIVVTEPWNLTKNVNPTATGRHYPSPQAKPYS